MHALYVETQPPAVGADIAVRLTRHLCVRQLNQHGIFSGPVAVVAQDPPKLLKQTQTQWLRLMRRAQRARRETTDPRYLIAFADLITMLQCARFTTVVAPEDEQQHNITFATASDYSAQPPFCKTIYITYHIPTEQLHQITAWMPRQAMVVIFADSLS